MSELRKGDLVMVVRGGCGCYLGRIYVVRACPIHEEVPLQCRLCGAIYSAPPLRALLPGRHTEGYLPLSWLKKIDPLTEPEVQREESHEPA